MQTTAPQPGYTVICAYNDASKLQEFLLPSIGKQQGVEYELILLDNRENKYPAAAPALNAAARTARFDHLLFAHQDVCLLNNSWLAKSRKWIGELTDLGAVGVAGRNEAGLWSSVLHGKPPRPAGPSYPRPRQVQTLDGCLLIVPTARFAKDGFDERTVLGWHLYVMDYCLDLFRAGLKSYVLPQWVYHQSTGPADSSVYASALDRILRKHRGSVDTVYGTMGTWNTAPLS